MAGEKRTILSGKRARSRRKKALRAQRVEEGDRDTLRSKHLDIPRAQVEEMAPEYDRSRPLYDIALEQSPSASTTDSELTEDEELVIVCRSLFEDFCTQFVAPEENQHQDPSASRSYEKFTMHMPGFRETPEGFIAYTIVISTCTSPPKHFQLERRYSEFVALEAALERYLKATKDPLAELEWHLPPKTWFKLTQTTALEERRGQLQECLTTLLAASNGHLGRVPLLRDFLLLDHFGAQVLDEKHLSLA